MVYFFLLVFIPFGIFGDRHDLLYDDRAESADVVVCHQKTFQVIHMA
jgi:hypothetical protein